MSTYSGGGGGGGGVQPLVGAMMAVGSQAKWYLPGWAYGGTAEVNPFGDDWIAYVPIFVHRTHTFVAIGVYGGFSSGDWGTDALARLGIYSATFDEDDYLIPDALVVDAGTVSLDTAGLHQVVIDQELSGDTFYFLAIATHKKGGSAGTLDGPNEATGFAPPITAYQTTHPGAAPNPVVGQNLTDVVDNGLPASPAPGTGFGARYAQVFLRD